MTDSSSSIELSELWRLLRRVGRLTLNVRNNDLFPYGVSTAESGVLAIVHDMDGKATPATISRQFLRKPHTVSGQVAMMHRKGLVNKVKDTKRKNVVRVSLTKKGREIYDQVIKIETVREIFSVLSDEEQRQLGVALRKLYQRSSELLENKRRPLIALQPLVE